MARARQRAEKKSPPPPLTATGKRVLAQSYAALGRWQQALDIYNTLPGVSPQVKNECLRHLELAVENEALPESAWKDKSDIPKVALAYQCIDRQQWATAVS